MIQKYYFDEAHQFEVTLRHISLKSIMDGYIHSCDRGVLGMKGDLQIHPPCTPRVAYTPKSQDEVIDTVLRGLPLGLLYFDMNYNAEYKVVQGVRRLSTLCDFVSNGFKFRGLFFKELDIEHKSMILDHKLLVYIILGDAEDKAAWLKRVQPQNLTKA